MCMSQLVFAKCEHNTRLIYLQFKWCEWNVTEGEKERISNKKRRNNKRILFILILPCVYLFMCCSLYRVSHTLAAD